MLKFTVTFELDEEQLRDMFEEYDIKFTKKKVKELQGDIDYANDDMQVEMEERFAEIVGERIQDLFED